MIGVSTATLAQLAVTSFRVDETADQSLDHLESFFIEIATNLIRKRNSIEAEVAHPDGFEVRISAECYAHLDYILVQILRLSGDVLLFDIVYQQIRDFDFGRGEQPKHFFKGQLCPRIIPKPLPPPILEPQYFFLDDRGSKRKIEAV